MKLVFIGTGSAFTVGDNWNSNMYFESASGNRLLIDCGSDARHALHALGLDQNDFEGVYISHLHADHIGGLEWLAFKTMFDPKKPHRVDLYCAKPMLKPIWRMLSGGLSSLEQNEAKIDDYFNIKPLEPDGSFVWENVEFKIFQTIHQISNQELMPSFGIEAKIDGLDVVISTDTKLPVSKSERLMQLYDTADIIFQDCETSVGKSTVHAHYTELVTLAPSIKKKMWLYHFQPGKLPDAYKDGFQGFVQKGQLFDFQKPETLFA